MGVWAVGVALAAPPALTREQARQLLQTEVPGVGLHVDGERLTRVYGTIMAFGSTPEAAAEQFVQSYAAVFGVSADDLTPGSFVEGGSPVQPVMYEPERGDYKFMLVRYAQGAGGVPVFRGDLRVLTKNEPGYPVVLVASGIRDVDGYEPPIGAEGVDAPAAVAVVRHARPELTHFGVPQVVVWAGVDEMRVSPRLAVTFAANNFDAPGSDRSQHWLFVVDAVTGETLYEENQIIQTDVSGSKRGMATMGPKADFCSDELSTPMPFGRVTITGGNTAYSDVNGNFVIPNSGTSAVSVQSFMAGQYFTVNNSAGSVETLSLVVTPPGPANFLHNQANTSEQVRAQVNGYVHANAVRHFVVTHNPSYPTIGTQTNFPVYVNRSDLYCPGNAWYDGSSINFCASGSSYPNTAWSSVIYHEYGHHAVSSGGSGQGQYGEGVSDSFSVLILDDPGLGYGFYGDCNTPLRTADNTMQYPCTSDDHTCAQLLSGCVWSTRNELVVTEPANYLSILGNLMVNSVLLHSGTMITPQITIDFLTLDDNDGDLENGTPHFDEITTGFGAHNMWQGPPPHSDFCSQAGDACPGSYSGTTTGMTNDGSAGCGSSNSTPDVWYRYIPQTSGTLTLDLCDSSFDTVVSVHTGCPGTASNQIGCNDNAGWFVCGILPVDQSKLSVSVTAGQTYHIRVSGNNVTGAYSMTLSGPNCVPGPTCDDGIQNQGEQRIDCGGPCPACECLSDSECSDGQFCTGAETCDAYGECKSGSYPCGGGEWCHEEGDACLAYGDGDFDADGDVDLLDFADFQTCFGMLGTGACTAGNLTGPGGMIDVSDFAGFSSTLTGPQ